MYIHRQVGSQTESGQVVHPIFCLSTKKSNSFLPFLIFTTGRGGGVCDLWSATNSSQNKKERSEESDEWVSQ